MTIVITLAVVLTYLAAFVRCARVNYSRLRPSRVPVCGVKIHKIAFMKDSAGYDHVPAGETASASQYKIQDDGKGEIPSCYGRWTDREAFWLALMYGSLWPAFLVSRLSVLVITGNQPDRPAERKYRITEELAQAEKELARVTVEMEKGERK